jgi:hypothetical protein
MTSISVPRGVRAPARDSQARTARNGASAVFEARDGRQGRRICRISNIDVAVFG